MSESVSENKMSREYMMLTEERSKSSSYADSLMIPTEERSKSSSYAELQVPADSLKDFSDYIMKNIASVSFGDEEGGRELINNSPISNLACEEFFLGHLPDVLGIGFSTPDNVHADLITFVRRNSKEDQDDTKKHSGKTNSSHIGINVCAQTGPKHVHQR